MSWCQLMFVLYVCMFLSVLADGAAFEVATRAEYSYSNAFKLAL